MRKVSPKVSIIIPVYNAANYLPQCLDSVINQTFRDIEIICVDDGSTDISPQILKEYAQKDERIQVITQKNSHQSVARNNGVKHSVADYVMYVDADDYIDVRMVEIMYNAMVEYNPDVVVCDVENIVDETLTDSRTIQICKQLESWFNSFSRPSGLYRIAPDIKGQFASVIWNKLYKASIIHQYNIYFPNGKEQEDEFYLWAYMLCCKSCYFVQKKLYHYIHHPGSLMDRLYHSEIALDVLDQYENIYNFVRQHKNIEIYKIFISRDYMYIATNRLLNIDIKLYPSFLKKVYSYISNCDSSDYMIHYYNDITKFIEQKYSSSSP